MTSDTALAQHQRDANRAKTKKMAPSFYTDVELYDAEPHIGCSIVFFSMAVFIFFVLDQQVPHRKF